MRTLLALGNRHWPERRASDDLHPLFGCNQITFGMATEIKGLAACPKCEKNSSIYRRIELEDKRAYYLEIQATCQNCGFKWQEIYEKGNLVKWVDMTPKPKTDPIEVVKTCPYCGKYCDSKSGFPFLFSSYRIRHYAHRECSATFGVSAPTPFGPPYQE